MARRSAPRPRPRASRKPKSRSAEDAVVAGVREIRHARGWTQEQLSQRMKEVGYPLNRSTIAKLEQGKKPRGVSVNEALAMAAALGVAPVVLFTGVGDEPMEIGTSLIADAWRVRSWIRGRMGPLPGAPGDREEERRSYFNTVPPREKELQDDPVFKATEMLSYLILEAQHYRNTREGVTASLVELIEEAAEDVRRAVRAFVREVSQRPGDGTRVQDHRP